MNNESELPDVHFIIVTVIANCILRFQFFLLIFSNNRISKERASVIAKFLPMNESLKVLKVNLTPCSHLLLRGLVIHATCTVFLTNKLLCYRLIVSYKTRDRKIS